MSQPGFLLNLVWHCRAAFSPNRTPITPKATQNEMQGFPVARIRRPARTDPSDLACTRPSALMNSLLYHWLASRKIPLPAAAGPSSTIVYSAVQHQDLTDFMAYSQGSRGGYDTKDQVHARYLADDSICCYQSLTGGGDVARA